VQIPEPLSHLPIEDLVPAPELFTHESTLHGQAHVSRVMVHAFRLIAATGFADEAVRLWACVYLHDLARTHDGRCHRHGADAWRKLETLPVVQDLLARGGVQDEDRAAIETAVTHHCLPAELTRDHPHWRLTWLLKDADGLDRVRLGDLDTRRLRFRESPAMAGFARQLHEATNWSLEPGSGYFAELWPVAAQLGRAGQA
jgi:hypothetical protein